MLHFNSRFALTAAMSLAAFSATAGVASAQDTGIAGSGPFRLNPATLEPGCALANPGTPVASHVSITQVGSEAHVSVINGSGISVDQVLVADTLRGYKIFNSFDTGVINSDPDIDPNQTATDLTGLTPNLNPNAIIVCVSDHNDTASNEPYVMDGLTGEVAAINRPVVRPTLAALGVSAVNPLNTYKAGFGYAVDRGYDMAWRSLFAGTPWAGGDPMMSPAANTVTISTRIKEPGVRRWNDIDEFGEAFGTAVAGYGQPSVFNLAGDPQAYLHNQAGLFTFTTQGDLPITWSLKPSLAPQSYGRAVSITDDFLRGWEASWQAYYAGKGPKPTLPLAPGTNSPAPSSSITVIVNVPELRVGTEAQKPNPVAATVTAPAVKPAETNKQTKTKLRMARLMKTSNGRAVQVFVDSSKRQAHLRIRLYSKSGTKLADATRSVTTNRFVKISGLKVAKQASTVKATVVG